MDHRLVNGDLVYDGSGDLKMPRTGRTLGARHAPLSSSRGSFACNPNLGSQLYMLDLHQAQQSTILAVLKEALEGLSEVSVLSVEKVEETRIKI